MSPSVRVRAIFLVLVAFDATASNGGALCPEYLQFLGSKCVQWQSNVLPIAIPAARGNAFGDNQAAAVLGMRIFFDNRFSQAGSGVACASCHDPEHAFAERKPTSHTIGEARRNAPDLINAAWYSRSHFWDGKVDNLWSAPLFTFEQDDEMGSSRLSVVHTLARIYKNRYESVFGSMPDFADTSRFPDFGKPGTPQFDAMTQQDQNLVNEVYANVGKALEAYVRKLAAGRSPFDDFMNGHAQSISLDAQRGMVAFSRHGCDECHSGPTFTDEGFHDLRYPAASGRPKDLARAGGIVFARSWQFSERSQFADPATREVTIATEVKSESKGFRTPSLRNVELTFPYGHDGSFQTLEDAIDAHSRVLPGRSAPDAQDMRDIIAFLRTLTGRPPQSPWNYWPGG